jgi:tetratricopeptide (TPR) repeat protein
MRLMTLWCGAALCALLPCASVLTHAQEHGGAIDQLVAVTSSSPTQLFVGTHFYPGEKITLRIRGPVSPIRKADYVERCTKRISLGLGNVCTKKESRLEIVEEISGGAELIPVLLEVSSPLGSPGPADIVTMPAKQEELVAEELQTTPLLLVNTESTVVELNMPDPHSLSALKRAFSLRAVVAESFGGRRKSSKLCGELAVGECGTGNFSISVLRVDSSARFQAVLALLAGGQSLSAPMLEAVLDPWLHSDIVAGRRVPNKERAATLSQAVLDYAMQNDGGPSYAKDRQAMFERALALNPDNSQAAAKLVGNLIENGDLVRAKIQLNTSLPKLRDAYQEEAQKTTVAAAIYLDYAALLGNAAALMISQGAKMDGSDIRSAVSLLETSINILDELRTKQITFGTRTPAELLNLYVTQADTAAIAGQILRDPDSLDRAIARIDHALRLLPDVTPGYLVGAGYGKGTIVVADAQLSIAAQRDEFLSARLQLIPQGLRKTIATDGTFALGVPIAGHSQADKLARVHTSIAGEQLEILPMLSTDVTAVGTMRAGRIILRTMQAGAPAYRLVGVGQSPQEIDADVVALTDNGYVAADSDGTFRISAGGTERELKIAGEASLGKLAALAASADGSLAVALIPGAKPRLILLDGAASDTQTAELFELNGLPGNTSRAQLIVTPSKHVVLLTDDVLCTVALQRGANARCDKHGNANMLDRLIAPGMVAKGSTVAYGLLAATTAGMPALHAFDVASLASNAPAGIKSTSLRLNMQTDWTGAYLGAVTVVPATGADKVPNIFVQVHVPSVPVTLRIQGGDAEKQPIRRSEPRFAGHAIVLPSGELVAKRRDGSWHLAGMNQAIAPTGTDPVWMGPQGTMWMNTGVQGAREVTLIDAGNKSTAIALGDGGIAYRALPVYQRDQSLLHDALILVPVAKPLAGTSRPLYIDPIARRAISLDVALDNPEDVLAILRHNAEVLLVQRSLDGIRLMRKTSGATTELKLLDGNAVETSQMKAFASSTRLLVRQIAADGKGRIAVVRLDKLPEKNDAVVHFDFETASIGDMMSAGTIGQGGIGQVTPGYIDAAAGILAVPGGSCHLIAVLDEPAATTAPEAQTPQSVTLSTNVAVTVPQAFAGNGGQLETAHSRTRTVSPGALPTICGGDLLHTASATR